MFVFRMGLHQLDWHICLQKMLFGAVSKSWKSVSIVAILFNSGFPRFTIVTNFAAKENLTGHKGANNKESYFMYICTK